MSVITVIGVVAVVCIIVFFIYVLLNEKQEKKLPVVYKSDECGGEPACEADHTNYMTGKPHKR